MTERAGAPAPGAPEHPGPSVVATAGHVDHGKSSLVDAVDRDGPRSSRRGEAPGSDDRARVRVVHAPLGTRARVRRRPGARAVRPHDARRGRTRPPRAVRRRGRRGVEAAVGGAPRDRRRPRLARGGDRAHQARSRRGRRSGPRPGRGDRARPGHGPGGRSDRRVLVHDGRGVRRARRRAGRDARRRPRARPRRPPPPARRPRVLDQGLRHRRHGNAHGRTPRNGRGGRAPAVGDPGADPRSTDAPPGRRDRVAGLEGRGQPHRRPRAHRAGRGPGAGRRVEGHVRCSRRGSSPCDRSTTRSRRAAPSSCTPARPSATRGSASTTSSRCRPRGPSSGSRSPNRSSSTSATGSSCASRDGAERSPEGSSSTPTRRVARARSRHTVWERVRGRHAPSCRRSWSPNAGPCAADDVRSILGTAPDVVDGAVRLGGWWVEQDLSDEIGAAITARLAAFHAAEPAAAGEDIATIAPVDRGRVRRRGSTARSRARRGRGRPARDRGRARPGGRPGSAPVPPRRIRRRGRRSGGGRSECRAHTAVDRRAPRGRRRPRPSWTRPCVRAPWSGSRPSSCSPASSSNARGRSSARPARTASR